MSISVLVTGATGYIGGQLVPQLLDRGYRVRVLVRNPDRLQSNPWRDQVEVLVGDATDRKVVVSAMDGVQVVYFLIHSMTGHRSFADRDRHIAGLFAASVTSDTHLIYLGGLLPTGHEISPHLSSRVEVGEILRQTGRATEFRAGPIIGRGSASFDMVRYLTERLPVMITPRWVSNAVQPIGVEDVLRYLVAASVMEPLGVVDIGADILTFKEMMTGYADVRGLKRWILPVPVLVPTLAALWVGLVTPIPNSLAVPLIQGVIHPVIGDTARARALFPDIAPAPYREVVRMTLASGDGGRAEGFPRPGQN